MQLTASTVLLKVYACASISQRRQTALLLNAILSARLSFRPSHG